MIEITGNNIAQILNEKAAKAKDPEAYRKEKLRLLEVRGNKNRISGLLKGTYQINLREALEVMEIFELTDIKDVVNYRSIEKEKPAA